MLIPVTDMWLCSTHPCPCARDPLTRSTLGALIRWVVMKRVDPRHASEAYEYRLGFHVEFRPKAIVSAIDVEFIKQFCRLFTIIKGSAETGSPEVSDKINLTAT
jgi:hypothetical protein